MNAHLNREVRGRIMKILNIDYPTWTGDHLIAEILKDVNYDCSPPQVLVHLNYLAEKGYIRTKKIEAPGFDISRNLAQLTARGKDLLEGSIDADPGVDLNG